MCSVKKNIPSQSGRRVLITGANSGLGFHTALELARKGAEIILPVRTGVKANEAMDRIQAEVPDAKLTSAVLDLSSLSSIRAFVAFYGEYFPGQSLDLLINNAGVMALPKRELTVDGFERQFATNYMGPFALTALLFPHLKEQTGTRIVTISSLNAHNSKIDFDNLQSERNYKPISGAYSLSKLADLMFTIELQRRLSANRSLIISTGAHPGVAMTNLQANLTGFSKLFLRSVVYPIITHDVTYGVLPTLFAATSPNVVPGGYYGPNGAFELKGRCPVPAKIPPLAIDAAVAQRLWKETERLTGVTFNPVAQTK